MRHAPLPARADDLYVPRAEGRAGEAPDLDRIPPRREELDQGTSRCFFGPNNPPSALTFYFTSSPCLRHPRTVCVLQRLYLLQIAAPCTLCATAHLARVLKWTWRG